MKFRRGGRLARDEQFHFRGQALEITNSYEYLGVIFQTGCFTRHKQSKVQKCASATYSISNLQKLSLNVALKPFVTKIQPIRTYAIPTIWEHLTVANPHSIDKVIATYLRRVLGLPRNTQNRLVHLLVGTNFLMEQVARDYNVPATSNYQAYL